MSESVVPVVDLESESDIDPGTEPPHQEASPVIIEEDENNELSEEDENSEVSEEDEDPDMTEEEKIEEEERWKQRERDYFSFKLEPEPPDERPLVGRELLRELALHKKMRRQVLEQIKSLRKIPYIQSLMLSSDPDFEDLDESVIDVQGAFMPHPYPL